MAVVQSDIVAYRRFSGYLDPRWPLGYWVGSSTGSGDASGGNITIELVFALASQASLSSIMFSLERVGLASSDAASREFRLSVQNMGQDGQAALLYETALATITGAVTRSPLDARRTASLPWFLGSQRIQGIQAEVQVDAGNPGVGVDFRFEAQGYYWGARSVLVDGGPQRPPTGLYPA